MIIQTMISVFRKGLSVQRENELQKITLISQNESLTSSLNLKNYLIENPETHYMLFLKKIDKYMRNFEYYQDFPLYKALNVDIDNLPLSSDGIFSENKMFQQICCVSILSTLLILGTYLSLDFFQFFDGYLINENLLSDIESNIGSENYRTLIDILSSIQDNPKSIKIAITLLADFNEVLKKQGFNITSLNKIITILLENME